jgi:hypothetical protein
VDVASRIYVLSRAMDGSMDDEARRVDWRISATDPPSIFVHVYHV